MEKFGIHVEKQSTEYAHNVENEELLVSLPKEEVVKTPENIALIKKAAEIVSDTLTQLGIENDFSINPEMVLIAKDGILQNVKGSEDEQVKLGKGQAFHKIIGGNVVLSDELLKDRQAFLHALVHEFFHAASENHSFLTKENENADSRLIGKSGYATFYDSQSENDELFNALNEAITEELTRESVRLYSESMFFELKEKEVLALWNSSYPQERRLLYSILLEMSGGEDEKKDAMWKQFAKDYTTGSMMHLRNIEKYYGHDSLKILAYITPANGVGELAEINEDAIEFFSEADAEKRNAMRDDLLERVKSISLKQ